MRDEFDDVVLRRRAKRRDAQRVKLLIGAGVAGGLFVCFIFAVLVVVLARHDRQAIAAKTQNTSSDDRIAGPSQNYFTVPIAAQPLPEIKPKKTGRPLVVPPILPPVSRNGGIKLNPDDPHRHAARSFLTSILDQVQFITVDGPERGRFATHPQSLGATLQDAVNANNRMRGEPVTYPAKKVPVAVVRVVFTYADHLHHFGLRMRDDWLIWIADDRSVVDYSGNLQGDNWRSYVRSLNR